MPKPNFFASPRKLKANSSPSSTRSPTDTRADTATTTTTNNDNFTSRSMDNPSSSLRSGSTALASRRASNGNDDAAVGLKSPAQVRKVAAQRRKDKGVKKSASSSASTVSPTRASLRSSRSDRGVLMSCMYLGAVPESVLPHVTRAVSDVERVVFPALLVELRKQAAWDIPAEVRVPRDSATPASAHLSIVRAVVAGTADASGGGEEVPVDVLVRVGPTNPVLTSKARPYRKLLAAWTDDGLVHIMQFPRSADVKTVAKAAARARMAQTDDDGTPHTREQGSAASTSSAEASSSPSGSDGESGTPDARSGEYGFSPAVEPSSMSSPPTAAEMRIKSAGERFHGALDAICAELRVRTSVLQEDDASREESSEDATLVKFAVPPPPAARVSSASIRPISAVSTSSWPSPRRRSSGPDIQLCHLLADLNQLAELPAGFDEPIEWQYVGGYRRLVVG